MLNYEIIHSANILNGFEKIEDFFEYFEDLEERGYSIIWKGSKEFVKSPLGQIYSFNKLEKFLRNTKLEIGNKKHIYMQKAYSYILARELYLEIKDSIKFDESYKKYCESLGILENSKDENEISEAKKNIDIYENVFEEGLFTL